MKINLLKPRIIFILVKAEQNILHLFFIMIKGKPNQ